MAFLRISEAREAADLDPEFQGGGVLPDVYFGKVEPLPDWREGDDEDDPDDDELDDEPTPQSVIDVLGFDPMEEDVE